MNAWKEKGMLQEDGLLIYFYYLRQDRKTLSRDVGLTAWCVEGHAKRDFLTTSTDSLKVIRIYESLESITSPRNL